MVEKPYKLGIFIFRRDLRLHDNSALLLAGKLCHKVLPCFIFDPRQIENNPYRGEFAVQFMLESIEDLSSEIEKVGGKLFLFYGYPHEVITQLINKLNADSVFINNDYTPFSKERDEQIKISAKERGVPLYSRDDVLLTSPDAILKEDGSPIIVFSRFYKRAIENVPVPEPVRLKDVNWFKEQIGSEVFQSLFGKVLKSYNNSVPVKGGRKSGLDILRRAYGLYNYGESHDMLDEDGTTMLSPYLKFGCLSVREVYWGLKLNHPDPTPIIRQLYWRDFFTLIANHYPEVFGREFNRLYRGIWWSEDVDLFRKWSEGLTGFPIVDAGIRELVQTGWMHNRARLITASFFTKDLHLNWRLGEKFFANYLVDYDPSVNNGNWQWCAGTGCDAQPYFRIFNPWLQARKFDPRAKYIKKWVPELRDLSTDEIHNWDKVSEMGLHKRNYPAPFVNHYEESEKTKLIFKEYVKRKEG
ncbi:MAG: DNA photolyase family protein [Candidatus Hydrogenedentes bacterium]|nr:DNA photolyase family protein [Candidatus Hydrogenedentota bacterium]